MPFSYLEFEKRFRGSSDDVQRDQEKYVRFFRDLPGPVVDLGCGRGEFLSLLREAGVDAYGVDAGAEMRAAAEALGHRVVDAPLLDHLEALPDASLGGLFMCHVVEHMPPEQVLRLGELAGRKVATGGTAVIETLNPQSLFAYGPFFMDPTHRWPVHPQMLQYLLEANGFGACELLYRQYLPAELLQLPTIAVPATELEQAFKDAMFRMQLVLDLTFKNFIYALAARRLDNHAARSES